MLRSFYARYKKCHYTKISSAAIHAQRLLVICIMMIYATRQRREAVQCTKIRSIFLISFVLFMQHRAFYRLLSWVGYSPKLEPSMLVHSVPFQTMYFFSVVS